MRRLLAIFLVMGLSLACPRIAAWGQAYDPATGGPPPGAHQHYTTQKLQVAPTADGVGIRGTCILDCYTDELDELHLHLKGLKKNGNYTVWVTRKEAGTLTRAYVGRGWQGKETEVNTLEARSNGEGNFHGWFQGCPLGKWRTIEVRFHPDGNTKNIQGSVPIVRISLRGE